MRVINGQRDTEALILGIIWVLLLGVYMAFTVLCSIG